jgi:carbonic anhydrase/acetyltransferase-like protein (isoleucine patch superfamily)
MRLTYKSFQPEIHQSVYVADDAKVIGRVKIGQDSSIWFGTIIRADVNYIHIGSRTNIQDASVVHVTTDTFPTIIGDEVTVGHRVTLHGCTVKNGCLIGIGSILLDGVEVGENSLVAAGSLLTPGSKFPPQSLIMGSPAKLKRRLEPAEVSGLAVFWKRYVDLKNEYLSHNTDTL